MEDHGVGSSSSPETHSTTPLHRRRRRHGKPPSSTTKVSIVKQLTLYAAPLPLDCRWMELHYTSPILADDSWRLIVEVLATRAGAPGGMLPCSMPDRRRLGRGGRCDLLVGAMCTDGGRGPWRGAA